MVDVTSVLQHAVQEHRAGAADAAEAAYRAVLAVSPEEPNALHLLGLLLSETGRAAEGLTLLARVRALQPDVAAIAYNHANILLRLERPEAALADYDAAVALQPDLVAAWSNRGQALLALDRPAEALASAEAGLALDPLAVGLHLVRAAALQALGETAAALDGFDAALALAPEDPDAHAQRANALFEQGAWEAALGSFAAALALQPDHVFTLYNLGRVHHERGDPAAALAAYDRVLQVDPAHTAATWNRRTCRLLMGDYSDWPMRWGWGAPGPERPFAVPRWDGGSLAGKRILLHVDQGLGDTLQFCRFVPRLAAEAALVVLEVQAPLVRLMRRSFGVPVIAQGDWHVPVDCHCNLIDMPGVLGLGLADIPAEVPYLQADPARWRDRLAAVPGRRVGLVWAGDARIGQLHNTRVDRRRSMRAAQLAGLAGCEGVSLISLQKGPPADQAGDVPGLIDWTAELRDFADTADLVAGLDLVITVDTSVVHLAGGLGVPVWLLNRCDTCWRWGVEREDSPWYPTLRQFRQAVPGDWPGVVARVRAALANA